MPKTNPPNPCIAVKAGRHGTTDSTGSVAGSCISALHITIFRARPDEVVSAALAGLRTGEVICVPGLHDPSMIDTISQAQQALLMTAVSSPLAERYRKEQRT